MTNLEYRVMRLEQSLRDAEQFIRDLQTQLGQIAQNQYAPGTTYGSGGSGGGDGYYCTTPGSGSWGATWTSGVPVSSGSFTATVYQIVGSTITNLGTQTINNWFPASPVVSKVIQVFPDGSGDYQDGPQSCV